MIRLVGFGPQFGLADASPFVLKIYALLTMVDIPFELDVEFSSFKKAPKGKLPYIEDNGELIADSFFITKYLKTKYKLTLDDHLSDEQQAAASLMTKALDDNFYWCLLQSRWLCDTTWPIIRKNFFSAMPLPLKHILPPLLRRDIKTSSVKHGMGKHSDEEILTIADDTLNSLSVLLGDRTYFFNDALSSFDATAYAFLAQVILVPYDNPLNNQARQYDNLVRYCQRIQDLYFLDAV